MWNDVKLIQVTQHGTKTSVSAENVEFLRYVKDRSSDLDACCQLRPEHGCNKFLPNTDSHVQL